MPNKFKPGDRVWGRHTGWDGTQYIVEEASDEEPDFKLRARSMTSGRLCIFSEAQMVRCMNLDAKAGAWEREHALASA